MYCLTTGGEFSVPPPALMSTRWYFDRSIEARRGGTCTSPWYIWLWSIYTAVRWLAWMISSLRGRRWLWGLSDMNRECCSCGGVWRVTAGSWVRGMAIGRVRHIGTPVETLIREASSRRKGEEAMANVGRFNFSRRRRSRHGILGSNTYLGTCTYFMYFLVICIILIAYTPRCWIK